ncbi:Crp/Fnr family transcriptional regulator [Microbaculum marinisediminis]|uniref:Crp/Fnr family transcriptional regulator n=1 Tax=Microbaculum marinisediminis TaxID=2931392 RepID=A0AAW5QWX6_9HYPH|nr:Crp/Fnr family transcriptional regulator [Microbaculum sp. A6E488]MCT8972566.1 Crp/Fnr family transcriptional regulator [Microbaculum sp. A6E488]
MIDPFYDFPRDVAARLDAVCRWRRVEADTLVIDAACGALHGVFVLAEGEVDVHRRDGSGEIIHLRRLEAVSCFGEFAALHGAPGAASVRTLTPCVIAEIDPATFVALLNEFPMLSIRLLRRAESRLKSLDEDMVCLRLARKRIDEAYRNAVLRTL